jgi:CubicO group peptidase (beta-lactamase class C family)
MSITVHGTVAPGYEAIADAFAKGFEGWPSMGAALSIRVRGQYVAQLWAGIADERDGRDWTETTPGVIFSCTKGLMSLALARLVEAGKLDYDAPVARYWPEFAAAGKKRITVREAVAHRAGLLAPTDDLSVDDITDWAGMTARIAAQAPIFPPDSGYAYHSITHGWLTGELVRRITGMSPGTYFAREIAGPLGADVWVGLPEEKEPQVAHLQVSPPAQAAAEAATEAARAATTTDWPYRATTLGGALPAALASPEGGFNDPRLHRAEIPGAGGIATADGLATVWSAAVTPTEGVRLVGPEVIERATRVVSEGPGIYPAPGPYYRWGMGFMLDAEPRRLLSARSFGHDGAGGQVAFADPTHEVGFAYITNVMVGAGDQRGNDVVSALRECLAR